MYICNVSKLKKKKNINSTLPLTEMKINQCNGHNNIKCPIMCVLCGKFTLYLRSFLLANKYLLFYRL